MALMSDGNYTANQLAILKTVDEDSKVNYIFTNKLGQKTLEREMAGNDSYDTYYVYDDKGNLCFVLQPMYQNSANIELYAFQYKYDSWNRCVWKKIPGSQYIKHVYDAADRLTFSQDGNQRISAKWTFYEYDQFDRLVRQGECTNKTITSNTVVSI